MASPSVLLVEGPDDWHVVKHLLATHQVSSMEVKDKGGIDNLLRTLPVELRASDLQRLGVVVDADDSLGSRWQSLRDILSRVGYADIPPRPHSEGTILRRPAGPLVGLWLMPDNSVDGRLEDFILSAEPSF